MTYHFELLDAQTRERVGSIDFVDGRVQTTEGLPPELDEHLRTGWWSITGLAERLAENGLMTLYDGNKLHDPKAASGL